MFHLGFGFFFPSWFGFGFDLLFLFIYYENNSCPKIRCAGVKIPCCCCEASFLQELVLLQSCWPLCAPLVWGDAYTKLLSSVDTHCSICIFWKSKCSFKSLWDVLHFSCYHLCPLGFYIHYMLGAEPRLLKITLYIFNFLNLLKHFTSQSVESYFPRQPVVRHLYPDHAT